MESFPNWSSSFQDDDKWGWEVERDFESALTTGNYTLLCQLWILCNQPASKGKSKAASWGTGHVNKGGCFSQVREVCSCGLRELHTQTYLEEVKSCPNCPFYILASCGKATQKFDCILWTVNATHWNTNKMRVLNRTVF